MEGTAAFRPPDRDQYLLEGEIKALLDAAKKGMPERSHRFLQFMSNSGVRPSESNRIAVRDIHPAECRVHVETIKQKKRKVVDRETGKTVRVEEPSKVFREVDLNPDYAKDLGKWIKGRPMQDRLFPVSRVALWMMFKKAASLAKLAPTYTLYSLRHSRCIYLLEWTNEDLAYVAKQMGHSSISVTMKYIHCIPSKRENIVQNRLGRF